MKIKITKKELFLTLSCCIFFLSATHYDVPIDLPDTQKILLSMREEHDNHNKFNSALTFVLTEPDSLPQLTSILNGIQEEFRSLRQQYMSRDITTDRFMKAIHNIRYELEKLINNYQRLPSDESIESLINNFGCELYEAEQMLHFHQDVNLEQNNTNNTPADVPENSEVVQQTSYPQPSNQINTLSFFKKRQGLPSSQLIREVAQSKIENSLMKQKAFSLPKDNQIKKTLSQLQKRHWLPSSQLIKKTSQSDIEDSVEPKYLFKELKREKEKYQSFFKNPLFYINIYNKPFVKDSIEIVSEIQQLPEEQQFELLNDILQTFYLMPESKRKVSLWHLTHPGSTSFKTFNNNLHELYKTFEEILNTADDIGTPSDPFVIWKEDKDLKKLRTFKWRKSFMSPLFMHSLEDVLSSPDKKLNELKQERIKQQKETINSRNINIYHKNNPIQLQLWQERRKLLLPLY